MTTIVHTGSAKIYAFQPRRPAATREARLFGTPVPAQVVQPVTTVYSGSWYHEAAVQAERADKP